MKILSSNAILFKLVALSLLLVVSSCVQNGTSTVNFEAPQLSSSGANLQFVDVGDSDGSNISVTWNSFSSHALNYHRLLTYTDSSCTVGEIDHGSTGSSSSYDITTIRGLSDGTYWAKVVAVGSGDKETKGECSTDSIIIDSVVPLPTGPADSFTFNEASVPSIDADGNDLDISWGAYTDVNLTEYQIFLHSLADCSDAGTLSYTAGPLVVGDSTNIDSVADGIYYGRAVAVDIAGNETSTSCSTDLLYVDSVAPVENILGIDPSFNFGVGGETAFSDGNSLTFSWNSFTEANIDAFRVDFYTGVGCTVLVESIANTGSTLDSVTATALDGAPLSDNSYFLKVSATDIAGNTTQSSCSIIPFLVDSISPTAPASPSFDSLTDGDGENIAITWTAPAVEINMSHYRVVTYDALACGGTATDHGSTGNISVVNNSIVTGLADGVFTYKIIAVDAAGNETPSACSSNSLTIDKIVPVPPADSKVTFVDAYSQGNNINITWSAFTDTNALSYTLETFYDSSCSTSFTLGSAAGSPNNTAITGMTGDGVAVWGRVTAIDIVGNQFVGDCSADTILIDSVDPIVPAAAPAFTALGDDDGVGLVANWNAFSDSSGIASYQLTTFDDSACSVNPVLEGTTTTSLTQTITRAVRPLLGYWFNIVAMDNAGNTSTSLCSSAPIIVDSVAPVAGAAPSFGTTDSNLGNTISIDWPAFTDDNLVSYEVYTYTDVGCTANEDNHGKLTAALTTDSAIITGLTENTYYFKIRGHDIAGHTSDSPCSSNSLSVDFVAPTYDALKLVTFTGESAVDTAFDNDGDNLGVSFDSTMMGGGIVTYEVYLNSTSTCNTATGILKATVNSAFAATVSTTISGAVAGENKVYVVGYDAAGNSATSNCSTSTVIVDTTPPVFTAVPYFLSSTSTGAVDAKWAGASDTNIKQYTIQGYSDSTCTTAVGAATAPTLDTSLSFYSDSITFLLNGTYYVNITAVDKADNSVTSSCSNIHVDTATTFKSVTVDGTPTAASGIYFSTSAVNGTTATNGTSAVVNWTVGIDTNSFNHDVHIYDDAGCTNSVANNNDVGAAATTTTFTGLATPDIYWTRVRAHDVTGNEAWSPCIGPYYVEASVPTGGSAPSFTAATMTTGDNVSMSWTVFTDTGISEDSGIDNHQINLYTVSGCGGGLSLTVNTGSASAVDNGVVDGLSDGTYYATVTAIDAAGNSSLPSACSSSITESIIIDSAKPVTGGAPSFAASSDLDGLINLNWTEFSDLTSGVSSYSVNIYQYDTEALATTGLCTGSGGTLTNSAAAFAPTTPIAGGGAAVEALVLAVNKYYYAQIVATDVVGNSEVSACSGMLVVDNVAPVGAAIIPYFSNTTTGVSDGTGVEVTFNSFTDQNMDHYDIDFFTDSNCLIPSVLPTYTPVAAPLVTPISIPTMGTDGTYWVQVTGYDKSGLSDVSTCSIAVLPANTSPTMTVDTTAPIDNIANPQFTEIATNDGTASLSWTHFTDATLDYYTFELYSDSACGTVHTYPTTNTVPASSASVSLVGLVDGEYWVKIKAFDRGTPVKSTESSCSVDSVVIDSLAPASASPANLQFIAPYDDDGASIAVSWEHFIESNLKHYVVKVYDATGCSGAVVDFSALASTSNFLILSTNVFPDGEYWLEVTAEDIAGNTTTVCSQALSSYPAAPVSPFGSVIVDTGAPADYSAIEPTFSSSLDADGDGIIVSWGGFGAITDRIIFFTTTLYSDVCVTPVTSSNTSGLVQVVTFDGLSDNTYYARVVGEDMFGNTMTTSCSSTTVEVDSTAPGAPVSNPTFNAAIVDSKKLDDDGNNVEVNWVIFSDAISYEILVYSDATCSTLVNTFTSTETGAGPFTDSSKVDGLDSGKYWVKVRGSDEFSRTTTSNCSTEVIYVDKDAPTLASGAIFFTESVVAAGAVTPFTWSGFTDTFHNIYEYSVEFFDDVSCASSYGSVSMPYPGYNGVGAFTVLTIGVASNPLPTTSFGVSFTAEGTYRAIVTATDFAGNVTTSNCVDSDSVVVDGTAPTAPTWNTYPTADLDGNNISISWNASTDANLWQYLVQVYNATSCGGAIVENFYVAAPTINTSLNGLGDGIYSATVTAWDFAAASIPAGHTTVSACSSDLVIGSPNLEISNDGVTFGSATTTHNFGSLIVPATKTITVKNNGTAAATVPLIVSTVPAIGITPVADVLTDYFYVSTDNCTGAVLAIGASCTFDVLFHGKTAPSGSGFVVVIVSGAAEGGVSATLDGVIP